MKFKVSMPSKSAIALTAVGFAIGSITAYVAVGHGLPFIGSLAGGKHDLATNDNGLEYPQREEVAPSERTVEHVNGGDDAEEARQRVANAHGQKSGDDSQKVDDRGEQELPQAKRKGAEQEVSDHDDSVTGEGVHRTQATAEGTKLGALKSSGKLEVTSDHAPDSVQGPVTKEEPHWGYDGEGSPEQWAFLSPQYKACGQGMEQAPIDLTSGIKGDVTPAFFSYKAQPLRIENNGHTIQVGLSPESFVTIGGKRYELVQFHFHHPSEHLLDGSAFPLELHLVHKAADGAIAVVGVFFKTGTANPNLEKIFSRMPPYKAPAVLVKGSSNVSAFLPKSRAFYRYMGSLTTPPCTEGLTWTVFKEPLEASQEQLDQFARLFPHNARPVQPRNRRFLIEASVR